MARLLFMVVLTLFACVALVDAQGVSVEPTAAEARTLFQQRRFAEAFGRFVVLADAGDPASAQMALFMYLNGPQLFGTEWDASPEQLEAWSRLSKRRLPESLHSYKSATARGDVR